MQFGTAFGWNTYGSGDSNSLGSRSELVSESLGRLLRDEPDFQIVGSYASTNEALDALKRESADIVLIDSDPEEVQRLDFLKGAKRVGFDGRVLITTARMSGCSVLRALESGTSGIVLRSSSPCELVKAIHQVASGELWLDAETVEAIAEAVRSGEHRHPELLSVRERAVLKAILEGLTNPQIAVNLESIRNPGVTQLSLGLGTGGTSAERLLPVRYSGPWSWFAKAGAPRVASNASVVS